MKASDYGILSLLVVAATMIWLRNTSWVAESSDTLPILISLPLFIWLGNPWRFNRDELCFSTKRIGMIAFLFVFGVVADLTVMLALAWVLCLWTWLSGRIEVVDLIKVKRLLILPLMAFPWVVNDLQSVGWFFRLTGAWVNGFLFQLLGYEVIVDGTMLTVGTLPVEVSAACSGLNALQSLLIAGSIMANILIGSTSRYYWNLPLIPVIAWVANTSRIIVLTIAALAVDVEFAMGMFHSWGGWFVLMVAFFLSYAIFSFQGNSGPPNKAVST